MAMKLFLRRAATVIEKKSFLVAKRLFQWLRFSRSPGKSKESVFVCGNQRSGTNMMMDVLERSYETDVYHETDERAFSNYEMRDKKTIQQLITRSVAPCVVVKALCESQYASCLLTYNDSVKLIWMVRDYNDVVNSMVASFRNMAQQAISIKKDRNAAGWRGRGMSDETHAIVCRLVQPEIDDISASALQWYFRNILYFELNLERDPRVLVVSYDSLVTNPREEFENIFDFLRIRFSSRVCNKIYSSSIRKKPPPVIDPAIRGLCDQLMNRYNELLMRKYRERG